MVKKILVDVDRTKEKDMLSVKLSNLPLPKDFVSKKIFFKRLGLNEWAGNHKHARIEIFISWDELTLIWRDEEDRVHKEKMGLSKEKKLKMFVVEPNTAHVVVNETGKTVTMIEMAEGKLEAVEEVDLLG